MKLNKKHPNILLIIMDSARSDMFGCYGNNENLTPNIDSLAKDSVICKNFYAAGSGSALSHVALFTGQHSVRNGVVHNLSEIKKDLPSITKILKANSFMNFGKSQIICPPIGYDKLFKFDELVYPQTSSLHNDKVPLKKKFLDHLRQYPQTWTFLKYIFTKTFGTRILLEQTAKHFDGQSSLNYLYEKIKNEKNFCFAYSTIFHPHTPYCPPKWAIEKIFGSKKVNELAYAIQTDFHAWLNGNYGKNKNIINDLKNLYKAELLYGDFLIGELIKKLKIDNKYDDTMIILTGDHGEFFGEHEQLNHGGTVYNEVLKVPCIIKFPDKIKKKHIIEKLTSHYDLFPTIMKYLNIDISDLQLDGQDIFLKDEERFLVIDSPPLVLPARLSHYPKVVKEQSFFWRCLINKNYKYVWKSDETKYLFKRDQYENESNNLIQDMFLESEIMHKQMIDYYRKIDKNFSINVYPINIGKTAAKFITSPRIIRELKKEGYL